MPDFDAAENTIRTCPCDHCGQYMPVMLAMIVEKITNRKHIKLHFCSETCANEYYLNKLREGGL